MPKRSKYPRLRAKTYKGASGQRYVYYVYDMRSEGKPDVRLGKDWAEAVRQWDELHNRKPRIAGRLQEAFDRWKEKELPNYTSKETRKSYTLHLKRLGPVFGEMVWDEITLPILRKYLDLRTAKFQGNREISVLSIIWGKALLWGMTQKPWPAAGVRDWKNKEAPRQIEVTEAMFSAVYAQADQVVRDAMDIASATGMRLTDARTVRMPVNGILRHKAGKTDKWMEFEVASSPVLTALVQRREKVKADTVMLLTTARGRPVGPGMLWKRWDEARERAAEKAAQAGNKGLAQAIRGMYLRDMRKLASQLAGSLDEASKLLQHDSQSVTRKHYRQSADKLRAVR
jgi:hypothetical protein